VKLSIFDLDKTILKINTSFHYYIYLYKNRILPFTSLFKLFKYYIKYQFFNLSPKELHNVVFNRFLKGKYLNIISDYVDTYLEKYLSKSFYLPSILKMQTAINRKDHVILLSNSPDFLVKKIVDILKINDYRASTYIVDAKNRLLNIEKIIDGKEKKKIALKIAGKLNIKKENIEVYSDCIWDLPLFDIAGKKIAVNPSKKLLKHAKKNNWEII
jgi:phosphoserine phosphatase